MVVDTNSNLWKSVSAEESTRIQILDFLKENPEQAFTAEEISREVLDMDFEMDIPHEELPVEEMLGLALSEAQYSAFRESFVKSHTSALAYEEKVEVRILPTDVDGEEVEMSHYTISD